MGSVPWNGLGKLAVWSRTGLVLRYRAGVSFNWRDTSKRMLRLATQEVSTMNFAGSMRWMPSDHRCELACFRS